MDGRHIRHKQIRRLGFTLVELLVAMAVFSIIMSGVVGVYISSMRAVRTGFQSLDANEEARSALSLMERELASALTVRDRGSYQHFYGTPVGMMLVGLERMHDAQSASPNLGRITYVVFQEPTGSFPSTRVIEEEDEDTGVVTQIDEVVVVNTYAVLRYRESDKADLDTYDFGPSYPNGWESLRLAYPVIDSELDAVEALRDDGWPENIVQDALRTKRRQLWIRMLSVPRGNTTIPSFWDIDWDDDESVTEKKDPVDYVILENLAVLEPWPVTDPQTWQEDLPVMPDDYSPAYPPQLTQYDYRYFDQAWRSIVPAEDMVFFQYGITGHNQVTLRPFWNAEGSLPKPLVADAEFPVETQPIESPIFQNALASDDDEDYEPMVEQIGTPFNPRLPEVVQIRGVLRYKSPYIGAPDTLRPFNLLVEVPAGAMRSAPYRLRAS